MYPQRELIRLAAYKAALCRDIDLRRNQCAAAGARAARPLEWVDRVVAFWRRLSPLARFAAVPLGFLLNRRLSPRRKIVGSFLRWGPVVLGALRGFRTAVAGGGAARRPAA